MNSNDIRTLQSDDPPGPIPSQTTSNTPVRPSTLLAGIGLIALGGLFFLLTLAGSDLAVQRWWPLFILMPGVLIFTGAFTRRVGSARGPAVSGGTFLVLLGLYFLATTTGIVSWSDQSDLWPIYLVITGIALLAGRIVAFM